MTQQSPTEPLHRLSTCLFLAPQFTVALNQWNFEYIYLALSLLKNVYCLLLHNPPSVYCNQMWHVSDFAGVMTTVLDQFLKFNY